MNPLDAMVDGYQFTKDYSMPSEEYRKLLLENNLAVDKNINISTFGRRRQAGILVDPKTEYYLNNFAYRDVDWVGKAEILAVGCSNTYGFGVVVDGRWTNILEKKINKQIRNLSIPGGSVNELVAKSFEYFKIFGNPDTMLCLFPDPLRIKLPYKKNIIEGNFDFSNTGNDGYSHDLFLGNVLFSNELLNSSRRLKYFKTPYSYGDILPLELPIFLSMQSIHMLEQYCRSNNIKLIWSTWHQNTINALTNVGQNTFSNFVFNKDLVIGHNLIDIPEYAGKNCHKESRREFGEYFDIGNDIEDGINFAHPGVHKHFHIAEAFYEEMNK